MQNKDLQSKYDSMHKQGASAWFSDGREERETILKMGEPWRGLDVLEIGCGEGHLGNKILKKAVNHYTGVDYSEEAIKKAKLQDPEVFILSDYHNFTKHIFNRLVMQGVLEHLDDPFTELKWMMDNLLGEHGDVITSSPCFLNPRGIVWMTLDMLGAVMSKTDLHHLNPWEFEEFCDENNYLIDYISCDKNWAFDHKMLEDLTKRIPLALKDGNIKYESDKLVNFLNWLYDATTHMKSTVDNGATMVYRITK